MKLDDLDRLEDLTMTERPLAEVQLAIQCKTLDVGNQLWWPGNRETEGEIARSTITGPTRMETCPNPEYESPVAPTKADPIVFGTPESFVCLDPTSTFTPAQADATITAVTKFLEELPADIRNAVLNLLR